MVGSRVQVKRDVLFADEKGLTRPVPATGTVIQDLGFVHSYVADGFQSKMRKKGKAVTVRIGNRNAFILFSDEYRIIK
jgi:hypothetical protein